MAHVLIVDDDKLILTMASSALSEFGHTSVQASNGKEALKQLTTTQPDAVILDILMPEKEGLETLIEIRRTHARLPVLVISGGGHTGWTDAIDMALKLGADHALRKPFAALALIDALNRVLNGRYESA